MLYDETVCRGRSNKLTSQCPRPHEIIAVNGVNVTIKKRRNTQKIHERGLKSFH